MTAISNNDIARAAYLLLKDKSQKEQLEISEKVAKFLFRKRLLSKAPAILAQLKKIINQEEGRIVAKISSVEALGEKTKTYIKQALKKIYSKKKIQEVILTENIDPKLLGGLKIEVENEIIDLSIKNKIGKLQEYLIKYE